MTAEKRLAARRQHVEPWAEEILQECLKLMTTVLPKTARPILGLHGQDFAPWAPREGDPGSVAYLDKLVPCGMQDRLQRLN